MPLLNKRTYFKREPYRDANFFIVICEGEKKEPNYFDFFDGLTSRIKIEIVPSEEGKSAPNHLIENAHVAKEKYGLAVDDELWFIVDTDRWESHLHNIQEECRTKTNWNVAISNPCFEVWLYYHFENKKPDFENSLRCSGWKPYVNNLVLGGFDCNLHPALIDKAINNAKKNYSENGYIPSVGSTQVFRFAEKIYSLVKKSL